MHVEKITVDACVCGCVCVCAWYTRMYIVIRSTYTADIYIYMSIYLCVCMFLCFVFTHLHELEHSTFAVGVYVCVYVRIFCVDAYARSKAFDENN